MEYKTNVNLETLNLKNKTNNAYLMSQNHHQILENERERDGKEKKIQNNKDQIIKKSNVNQ